MVRIRKQRTIQRPFATAAEVLEWKELLSAAAKAEKPESINVKKLTGTGYLTAPDVGIDSNAPSTAAIKASKLVEGQPFTIDLDLGAISPLPAISASITGKIKSVDKSGDERTIMFRPNQDSITTKVKTPLGKITIQVTPVNADVKVNYNVAAKVLSFSADFNVVVSGALNQEFVATISFQNMVGT